ncbi:Uncharacterized protein Rs2_18598 [Raphanus sativus]|nr:Uncharacterized protein Rs2_18598 [Raphanus sativus]
MVSGISYSATVSEAASSAGWRIPRGRHPLNQFLRATLAEVSSTMDPSVQDFFQWRHSSDSVPGVFSWTKTWKSLYPGPAQMNPIHICSFNAPSPRKCGHLSLLTKG